MRYLTIKEVNAVRKIRFRFTNGLNSLFEGYSDRRVLEVIKYCKNLILVTKRPNKNIALNEGEQPGIIQETRIIPDRMDHLEIGMGFPRKSDDEVYKELPKSKSKYGYTHKEIDQIIKDNALDTTKFWKAFGVNTCMLLKGQSIFYKCDIERALYKLGCKLGKNHAWD